MKSKDEFREDVYRRFDEYKKNKEKKRRAALKYGGIAFSALSVIALLVWPGIGIVENVWKADYAVGTSVDANEGRTAQYTGEGFSEIVSSFDGDATTEESKSGETSAYSTAATSVASIEKTTEAYTEATTATDATATVATTEATIVTIATTEATAVTIATTEAYTEATVEATTAATTAAYTEATVETVAVTEATVEATTAVYTEATVEATTAVQTDATLSTGEEITVVYESKYGVTVNGTDIIEAGYFPPDSNELINLILANADKCGCIIITPGNAESVFVYVFFVKGTANIKSEEKTHGEINSCKYVIEIQSGEELNMYLCYFDSEYAVEVNIIK